VISSDLTRNDKAKQGPSGGPITKDNTSIEYYGTIFTVMESPLQAGTIWTGFDDGLVHVTRDGGKNWSNVTPPKGIMPEWIQINSIEASPFDPATAYVAATMYKFDDYKPYLYVTNDYGKSWKKITSGIPDTAFTRVIREDPNKRGLVYAGTETGIYVSFDNGANWQPLQLNLPVTPITDIAIQKREQELVVATQGRSFWIFDDLPLLHQLMDAGGFKAAGEVHLFEDLVLAHVRRDHLPHLAVLEEGGDPEVVGARVVAHHGEVLRPLLVQGGDEVLGDPAQAEARHHDGGAVRDVPDRRRRVLHHLVHDSLR
jgi:hypothetical protein